MDTTSSPIWVELIPLSSTLAILFSAFIAYRVAKKNLKRQEIVARRRYTIDTIMKLETDAAYNENSSTFGDARNGGRLLSLVTSTSSRDREEYLQILSFLNHYEVIIKAIQSNIMDELVYYQWYRGTLIRHWHESKEFIHLLRSQTKNNFVFYSFELMATSWENEKLLTRSDINNVSDISALPIESQED